MGRRQAHLEHGEHPRCQTQRGETDCTVSDGEIRAVCDGTVQVLKYAVPGVGDETNQRVRTRSLTNQTVLDQHSIELIKDSHFQSSFVD